MEYPKQIVDLTKFFESYLGDIDGTLKDFDLEYKVFDKFKLENGLSEQEMIMLDDLIEGLNGTVEFNSNYNADFYSYTI